MYEGPTVQFAQELHAMKYRSKGETFTEYATRVADALKDNKEHFYAFRDLLGFQMFLPGGRIQSAAGSLRAVTEYSCFVQGIIHDSMGSITKRFGEALETMRVGGGIGMDYSRLRYKGAEIQSLESVSSGPVSFMDIWDAGCKTIMSAGHRRGAMMAVLRVDHPDIDEFIKAKHKKGRFTQFNMSVGITNEFMECMAADAKFDLRFEGKTIKTVKARSLWKTILRSTLEYAEPGVIFLDTINEYNNLRYCEEISATNPCAEQPLPPHGACLLGSINLVKFVVRDLGGFYFDWDALREAIPVIIRAMDNVVNLAHYPLVAQKVEAISKRRMGIGVTGMANTCEILGMPYGYIEYVDLQHRILNLIKEESYKASIELAQEKGSFPLFDKELYCESKFIQSLPSSLVTSIRDNGIRNSHLLSIAPTGTISLAADIVSSGIEPVFKHSIKRDVQTFDGPRTEKLTDYGWRVWGHKGKTAHEVPIKDHLTVLANAYRHVDSAVSKTVNVPEDVTWEDFRLIYWEAWKSGCKGLATFTENKSREPMMREDEACTYNPDTGEKSCDGVN